VPRLSVSNEENISVHVPKILPFLLENGPLGTAAESLRYMQRNVNRFAVLKRIFDITIDLLYKFQCFLDGSFDRLYGTDTSGIISLENLTIRSNNVETGIRYEPMSVRTFAQIMNHLTINFSDFQFVDFGSGKGRVLLLASKYGFDKVIGIEFAQELHNIATNNIRIYKNHIKKVSRIENIYGDATSFVIPNKPLIIFFYSPFRGKTMKQVLDNVYESFAANHRKISIIFYGKNTESIELLKALNFQLKEIEVPPDFSRFLQYQSLLFTSPNDSSML